MVALKLSGESCPHTRPTGRTGRAAFNSRQGTQHRGRPGMGGFPVSEERTENVRGTTVRCTVPGGRPIYGRTVPGDYPPGLVYVRLSADHARGRKGERVYALAKHTAPWGRARHASGVHRSWWTRLPQGQHAR